jgi:hypothetical protein
LDVGRQAHRKTPELLHMIENVGERNFCHALHFVEFGSRTR